MFITPSIFTHALSKREKKRVSKPRAEEKEIRKAYEDKNDQSYLVPIYASCVINENQ